MDKLENTDAINDNKLQETINWLFETVQGIKRFTDRLLETFIHDEIDAWIQRLHFELLAITLNCIIIMNNLVDYKESEYELLNIIRDINHSAVSLLFEFHKSKTLPNNANLSETIEWLNIILNRLKNLTSSENEMIISEIDTFMKKLILFNQRITEYIRLNFILNRWIIL